MRFTKKKFRILDDVIKTGVSVSPGFKSVLNNIKNQETDRRKIILGSFCEMVIHAAEKAFYISKEIGERIETDTKLQNKLHPLLHDLEDFEGIFLLPGIQGLNGLNTVACKTEKALSIKDKVIHFGLVWYSENGIELFNNGRFQGDIQYSENIIASDLSFKPDPDLVIRNLINFVFYILLLIQFAEIDIKIIQGGKGSTIKKAFINNEKHLNETPFKIEIINSNWFTRIIRSQSFNVSGHFRLQPYGKGRTERKLIWIDEYEKSGYNLSAKKEREDEEDE